MSRQAMSAEERDLRSHLTKLLYDQPVLRGYLAVREITCGDPNCRCARGETHDTLYLSYNSDGKKHQISIPHDLNGYAQQARDNYRQVLELLDELCGFSHKVINSRKRTSKK